MNTCTNFAGGPMTFSEIALWDEHMSPIAPNWLYTGPKICSTLPPCLLRDGLALRAAQSGQNRWAGLVKTVFCADTESRRGCADGAIKATDSTTMTITHSP